MARGVARARQPGAALRKHQAKLGGQRSTLDALPLVLLRSCLSLRGDTGCSTVCARGVHSGALLIDAPRLWLPRPGKHACGHPVHVTQHPAQAGYAGECAPNVDNKRDSYLG